MPYADTYSIKSARTVLRGTLRSVVYIYVHPNNPELFVQIPWFLEPDAIIQEFRVS